MRPQRKMAFGSQAARVFAAFRRGYVPGSSKEFARAMMFWIAAGVFALMVLVTLIAAYLRPRAADVPAAAYDLQVYRDQLAELDRDLARGLVAEDDAAQARTEIARRILEADRALKAARAQDTARGTPDRVLMGAALTGVIAGTVGVYLWVGAPGTPDMPLQLRIAQIEELRATRPAQAEAEEQVPFRQAVPEDPQRARLVEQLRTVMEQRPDDPEGLRLLAANEAALGNFRAARLAQERFIALLGDDATGRAHIDLAEMMILAAGGYVSPEAEAALTRGLTLAPQDGAARYYAGLMFAQQGRPDLAFPVWRNLLADSPPDAPWIDPILLQIEEVAWRAGSQIDVDALVQPGRPARPGPSQDDLDAAAEMPEEARLAMIEGMVQGLAARLAEEGGPPEDWARLISSYIVLGREDLAWPIFQEALDVFAGTPAALAPIQEAGRPLTATTE